MRYLGARWLTRAMPDLGSPPQRITVDAARVRRLIGSQFPQWADLPVRPVAESGWDNATFHLGTKMIVRLPTAAELAEFLLALQAVDARQAFRSNLAVDATWTRGRGWALWKTLVACVQDDSTHTRGVLDGILAG
jgi:aminoglycoside phosphotransferase (APT) family kinase protein